MDESFQSHRIHGMGIFTWPFPPLNGGVIFNRSNVGKYTIHTWILWEWMTNWVQ